MGQEETPWNSKLIADFEELTYSSPGQPISMSALPFKPNDICKNVKYFLTGIGSFDVFS
jgi:hypothetical protein